MISAQSCDSLYQVTLSHFYNKQTDFLITTRMATSLDLAWTTECDNIGRHLAFFGQDSRRGKLLDQPYGEPAWQHLERSAFSTCAAMWKSNPLFRLSQSHSDTTRNAYKLYLLPEMVVQSSCNIVQNWLESVKQVMQNVIYWCIYNKSRSIQ